MIKLSSSEIYSKSKTNVFICSNKKIFRKSNYTNAYSEANKVIQQWEYHQSSWPQARYDSGTQPQTPSECIKKFISWGQKNYYHDNNHNSRR